MSVVGDLQGDLAAAQVELDATRKRAAELEAQVATMREALEFVRQTVHQAHHEGAILECRKNTCDAVAQALSPGAGKALLERLQKEEAELNELKQLRVAYEDDAQVARIIAERHEDPHNPRVELEVLPYTGAGAAQGEPS